MEYLSLCIVGVIPRMSNPKMSNPRMSNPKMSNPRMSNPKMSNAKMSANTAGTSLVPTPLSEKSRRGLATVPYNGLSCAVCTVRANQIAEFSYVTALIAS